MSYIDEWAFVRDAYDGVNGFADGSVIEQFARETDDKYAIRRESGQHEYENIFQSKIGRYVGYLFTRKPKRETQSDIIDVIKDDIDNSGNDADVFFSSFAKNAKARGVNLCLIESPMQTASNMQAQIQTRALPYVVEIFPERVTEYKLDKFGKFEYVAFSETIVIGGYQDQKIETIIRYYDAEIWAIYDDKGTIKDSAPHGLSECPVVIFSENGKFESLGEFSQIAGMAKRIYNLESELKIMLRGQTFSILTIWTEKGAQPQISLGTDNALLYSGDHPPAFISSDSSQAATYENRIEKVKESIDRVAYDVTTGKAAESGISLDIKFQGLNSSLNSFAQRMEDFEQRIWMLICQKLGMSENSITISYNSDFSIKDVQSSVGTLDAINRIADMPHYKAEKLKNIVKDDLTGTDSETMDIIIEEINSTIAKAGE